MEERRRGSKKAFVVAWLLTIGFLLAVGPFGSAAETVECDGADCVDAQVQTRTEPDVLRRDWRGREPKICYVNVCDERSPTFCTINRKLRIAKDWVKIPQQRDPCAQGPQFRTARGRG